MCLITTKDLQSKTPDIKELYSQQQLIVSKPAIGDILDHSPHSSVSHNVAVNMLHVGEGVEISLLVGLGQNMLWLNNPWQYPGFTSLAKMFLEGHVVLMGRDAWFDFPLKENRNITPWVLSNNQYFHMYTRARYSHVRFVDTLEVLQRVIPEKGIWWVLGGHSVFRAALPYATSVEATVVTNARGHVDLLKPSTFYQTHACPHPFHSTLKCVRYERPYSKSLDLAFQMQQVQTN